MSIGIQLDIELDTILRRFPSCVRDYSKKIILSTVNAEELKREMKNLEKITKIYNMEDIDLAKRCEFLYCSIYGMYYFWHNQDLRLAENAHTIKTYENFVKTYQIVLTFVARDNESNVCDEVFDFIENFQLWRKKTFVCDLLIKFTDIIRNEIFTKLTNFLLNQKSQTSKDVLEVMYNLAAYIELDYSDQKCCKPINDMVIVFVDVFLESLNKTEPFKYKDLTTNELSAFLRRVCRKLENSTLFFVLSKLIPAAQKFLLEENDLYAFGIFLEFISTMYKTNELVDLNDSKVFSNVLKMVRSENPHISIIGCRVFQHLIDRKGNRRKLKPLRIYFDFLKTDLEVCELNDRDVVFIDTHKLKMISAFTTAVATHCKDRTCFDDWFCCIALISLEIPCGMTAAWTSWITMKIQEIGLSDSLTDLPLRHAMHVLCICLVSLVSWVHKSQPLYNYLKKIAAYRSCSSPHLNPPIRDKYIYPEYHITWDKPDLFFDEWELRYCLWKTFGGLIMNTSHGVSNVDSYLIS